AVELAKVSLWLTTLAGDKPLTFLDANLRCGNSLIGAPLQRAGQGQENIYTIYTIHPEANKCLAKERGDTLASRGNKRGKASLWDEEEKEEQYTIFDELDDVKDTVPTLVDHRCMIAEQPSDTVENVHAKAAIFQQEVVNNEKRQMLERICNLWVATWFWKQPSQKKKPTDADWVPPLDGQIYRELVSYIREQFHEGLGQFVKIDPLPYFAEVEEIVKEVCPFHWELEFPEIYFEPDGRSRTNPGFTAVLGNPPWDLVMTNSLEFFSTYDPGFRELERVKALDRQRDILNDEEVKAEWESYVRNLDAQVDYFSSSELYEYQTVEIDGKRTRGHANTFKLFLERALDLLHNEGVSGMIVPSGIYTDQGCTGLRQLFLNHAHIEYLFCFENRRGIFPIDSRFKFVLLGVRKAPASASFDAAFMLHDLEVLSAPEEHSVTVPTKLIRRFSPDTLSIMEFRSQRDIDIIAHIYGNWPLLGETTWDITFAREFNLTDDRHFFNQKDIGWPLYEGKMIHQYTPRYSKPNYWIEVEKGQEELARREIQRAEDAVKEYLRSLSHGSKSSKSQANLSALLKMSGRGPLTIEDVRLTTEIPRLVFRRVASNTNERTIISTILPDHVFAVYTVTGLVPWQFNAQKAVAQLRDIRSCYTPTLQASELMYLCGVFNSFSLDYVIRFKVTTDVNMFHIYQLPVPRLTPTDPYCQAIAHRVAQLVCIGPEFDVLRRELLGDVNAHVATILDERQKLQNEIDALVAHLYGLHVEDLEHILYAPYTFPLVKPVVKDGVMAAFGRVEELLER
ncbi:MAG TPA: hypothetical protein VEL31_27515, partial [Ktedonobacteraceae bacterium]|nr:hypothetical protein [Ktedonobacteraceae bacterium]